MPETDNLNKAGTFLSALRREKTSSTPVWLMRQAGRYQKEYRDIREKVSFLELCRTPELASQVTVFAVRQLKVDAAIIFADILLILDALGMQLRFQENHGPVFDNPVQTADAVGNLPSKDMAEELAYVGKAIAMTVDELKGVPVIGFAGAPFTVASYAIEAGPSKNFTRTKRFMYEHPEAFKQLMEILTDATIDYLKMQVNYGASCLQLFDSWVGCLSPRDYEIFVLPHMQNLFSALKETVPTIYFGTGTQGLLESMARTEAGTIGVDWRVDLDRAWNVLGPDRGIQGNLDPVILLSDRPTIKANVEEILKKADGRPGHIFNLGHGILPGTPVDNAKYLVELVHELSENQG